MSKSSEIDKSSYTNNNPLYIAEQSLYQAYESGNMLAIYDVMLNVRATFGKDRADQIFERTISQFVEGYLNL